MTVGDCGWRGACGRRGRARLGFVGLRAASCARLRHSASAHAPTMSASKVHAAASAESVAATPRPVSRAVASKQLAFAARGALEKLANLLAPTVVARPQAHLYPQVDKAVGRHRRGHQRGPVNELPTRSLEVLRPHFASASTKPVGRATSARREASQHRGGADKQPSCERRPPAD